MFEHSVKVPRSYKVAANIFKKVSTEGGSVKTLLYDNKLRHYRTNALYALITETIKHAGDIDKLFENCRVLEKESRLDPWLAKVLTAELIFGKKILPGKSKPEQTILSYKEQFEKYATDHQDELKTEAIRRPRYVRVNTNLLTTSDAIRAFQDEGYRFIRCTSGSYDDYLKQIQALTEYDFTQDYHVKTVFVFSSGTKLHEHELYLENKIILQDKATAMAVHLLSPPSGSTILDMCAAPGMKTTQLAAYMRNEGKIYAVERNEKRYQTLCDFVENSGSKCVETMHKDSLEIKKGDLEDVEYILLDPSCSGSGMELCVHNYIDATRLAKLTSLQEKFLKHAMNAFPKAKRIVYSTCSLFPQENERVITNVVKTSRAKWRVQDVKELLKGKWNNFGSAMYGSMGTRCMYAKPDSDLTTGFFLAVLDRDEKDLEKYLKNQGDGNGRINNGNINIANVEMEIDGKEMEKSVNYGNNNDLEIELKKVPEETFNKKGQKKKKKDRNRDVNEVMTSIDDSSNLVENPVEQLPRKEKKKKKAETVDLEVTANCFNESASIIDSSAISQMKKNKNQAAENKIENLGYDHVNKIDLDEGTSYMHDHHNITHISERTEEKSEKKTKRKKCENEVKVVDSTIEQVDSQPVKKKKKKKDKHQDQELSADTLDVQTDLPKKKKKKKRIDQEMES